MEMKSIKTPKVSKSRVNTGHTIHCAVGFKPTDKHKKTLDVEYVGEVRKVLLLGAIRQHVSGVRQRTK